MPVILSLRTPTTIRATNSLAGIHLTSLNKLNTGCGTSKSGSSWQAAQSSSYMFSTTETAIFEPFAWRIPLAVNGCKFNQPSIPEAIAKQFDVSHSPTF